MYTMIVGVRVRVRNRVRVRVSNRLGLRVSLGISVIIRDRVRVRHVRLGISVGVEKAYVSNLLPIEVKSHFYSYH